MGDTSRSPTISTQLQRIAKQAKDYPAMVFTTLAHLMDVDFLREAYHRTRKDSAPWGKHSDAPLGLLRVAEGQFVVRDIENTMAYYRVGPVDQASYERGTQGGDSGALVAWNGSGNRQVVGLHFAAESIRTWLGLYQRADYIKTAFYNAGRSFDHYWGTDATASRPSSTQYDNPC